MPGKRVLLTGQPGVGKTTLTQKINGALKERRIPVSGFYTTEVRVQKERLGFDVITLDGKQGVLARKSGQSGSEWRRSPTVGQYSVNIPSFEKIALPTLQDAAENSVLIIDEIGKMELFSKPFIAHVRRLFDQHTGGIIATIPIARGKPLPLVEEIRNCSDVTLFTVTRENRDHLLDEIVTLLMAGIEQ